MRATLIFPPATDPRAPHLALPYLAAVLRRAGVETRMIDLDLGGLLSMLRPETVAAHAGRVGGKLVGGPPVEERLRRLARRAESLVEDAPAALATLRHPKHFYDAHRFQAAREAIFDALELASAAADRPVRYNIHNVQYEVEGVDPQRLADLMAVTADPRANLFEDYWRDDVFPQLERDRPDLVGITISNRQQVVPGLSLARRLRERGLFVVLGGTVFAKFVGQLARLPEFFERFADGVVTYEGETAVIELVAQLAAGRDFSRVPNFLYLERGTVRSGITRVEDLNALPTPDFAGLPLHEYLAPSPVLPILVGKGCYFNRCKFCDIPYINHVSKKAYRVRRAEKIVGDILELNGRFGCRHFEITDEALSPRLLEDLAGALDPYAERGLCFVGYARLEPGFTPALCAKLARMGMKKLFFGLESGDQATLDHMDKGIRIADVRPILSRCRDAGILFHLFSIIGFPEEGEASAANTLRFFESNADVIDQPGNTFDIHPFGLELRTSYFEAAERLGMIIPADALQKEFVIGLKDEWVNSRGLSHADVERLVAEYAGKLRSQLRRYHNCMVDLWPGYEEYAVLYADHYRSRPFPYRTSLPDVDDPTPFILSWNPSALTHLGEGRVRVASRWGEVRVGEESYELLGSGQPRTSREFPAEAREKVDGLIGARLLQLALTDVVSPPPSTVRSQG